MLIVHNSEQDKIGLTVYGKVHEKDGNSNSNNIKPLIEKILKNDLILPDYSILLDKIYYLNQVDGFHEIGTNDKLKIILKKAVISEFCLSGKKNHIFLK